jgi:hypothetical protein
MTFNIKLESFSLGGVLPYGWAPFPGKWNGDIMGHEFTMVGVFSLKEEKQSFFGKKKVQELIQLPRLIWREKEFWWERNTSGGWDYKGETDKGDLYQSSPGSPTWSGFAQGKTDNMAHLWLAIPGADVRQELRLKLYDDEQRRLVIAAEGIVNRMKVDKPYQDLLKLETIRGRYNEAKEGQFDLTVSTLAKARAKLPCAALDRPGMALSGGSGASGGGFKSLTTSDSRRRVLQFDLGLEGSATRFTATQVLETQGGKPAISKFLIPGLSDDDAKAIPDENLAYWRAVLNPNDVTDQTHEMESSDEIARGMYWRDRRRRRGML